MKLTEYFLPYQRRWILDDARMKLYAKSRRIGITYATSFRVNDKCLRRPGTVQWVTSRDEDCISPVSAEIQENLNNRTVS